ncbi:MAG: ATP-dependent dethiobiotin synthetase BioD [Puia sp.]
MVPRFFPYSLIKRDEPIFVSGIGTGIGKTVIAAIITEALKADYWKPVQAGYEAGTDRELVASLASNAEKFIHPGTDRELVASFVSNAETFIYPGTDRELVASFKTNTETFIHPESYLLKLAASPHIAAQKENRRIELKKIAEDLLRMNKNRPLVIEGAGGLMGAFERTGICDRPGENAGRQTGAGEQELPGQHQSLADDGCDLQ